MEPLWVPFADLLDGVLWTAGRADAPLVIAVLAGPRRAGSSATPRPEV